MNNFGWYTRIFVFYLLLIPTTIFIASISLCCFFLPSLVRYSIVTSWSHVFIWLAREVLGIKFKVTGKRNLPKPPFVVLCNHQSTWETIFMQVLLPAQSWVLKRELLYIPFFGWALALVKPIAIRRNDRNSIKVILRDGVDRIAEGRCIVFYPEGTRVEVGKTKRYARTGAALALSAQVPVIPVAHNAGNFWPKGPVMKKPGTIKIKIGKAISIVNKNPSEITSTAEEWINEQKDLLK